MQSPFSVIQRPTDGLATSEGSDQIPSFSSSIYGLSVPAKLYMHWFTRFLLPSSFQCWTLSWPLILWAAICFAYFCFIILASFCTEHLAFPAYYFCTNLVSPSLPCFMYSLRPTRAVQYMPTPVRRIHVHHFVFRCTVY